MGFRCEHSRLKVKSKKKKKKKHAAKSIRKGRQEGGKGTKSHFERRPEERRKQQPQEEGILCHLYIQGFEASSSRYRCVIQGYEHHELFRQRHLRTNCRRSIQTSSLQQEVDYHFKRNSNSCSSTFAW